MTLNRRTLIQGGTAMLAAAAAPWPRALANMREYRLVAAPSETQLLTDAEPKTAAWTYSGSLPGPEIRVRQGERLRLVVENGLPEPTTVHCHGIRLPNAMDGVPHLTQEPIAPRQEFVYEFDCPDAGTFWYHPHINSAAQVGRGLYGALIVEEREPPPFDREVVWILDDWRLRRDASVDDDFRNLHDITHAGRIGNTVTINGRLPRPLNVQAGERIRLRLINAANARVFALSFSGHGPLVLAIDGQPVEPHAPAGDTILLGPAMRVDLLLDMSGLPGSRHAIRDEFYARGSYDLTHIAYSEKLARKRANTAEIRLPANPLPEPDVAKAERHQVVLGGGMMGRMTSALVDGQQMDIRSMFMRGVAWSINGVAVTGHVHPPMLTLERNKTCILELINDTAWPHPMHLHGHAFRVISRNGKPEQHRPWQDTVLVLGREWAEIAFVADNPGDWMFHCHILEHQMAGMMGTIRVA